MPINLSNLSIRGKMHLQCADLDISVHFDQSTWIASFPSFTDLLSAKKHAAELSQTIKNIPRLSQSPKIKKQRPSTDPLAGTTIYLAVKERPVAKLISEEGILKIQPTILSFFTKKM